MSLPLYSNKDLGTNVVGRWLPLNILSAYMHFTVFYKRRMEDDITLLIAAASMHI
jgi:hypothetical protein